MKVMPLLVIGISRIVIVIVVVNVVADMVLNIISFENCTHNKCLFDSESSVI